LITSRRTPLNGRSDFELSRADCRGETSDAGRNAGLKAATMNRRADESQIRDRWRGHPSQELAPSVAIGGVSGFPQQSNL